MAHKTGLSHGFASVLLLVAGSVLVEYIKPRLPWLFRVLEVSAAGVRSLLRVTLHVDVPSQVFVPTVVVFILAFAWGVVYHLARFGKE